MKKTISNATFQKKIARAKKKGQKLDKWWLKTTGRKLTRKGLVKKADMSFSKYIRARDQKCVVCGTTENLTCGHLFSRVSYSLRWDERQCFAQCRDDNLIHEYDTHPFTSWFIRKFGIELYDQLHIEWKQTKKFKDYELADLIKTYEEKLKLLNP